MPVTVRGVDLYPPPKLWTAPNCIFEVDYVLDRDWSFPHKFDLVHLRHLAGGLGHHDWEVLYHHIYDNLQPGGWIEQVDVGSELPFIFLYIQQCMRVR